jgi:hypothetical protein
MKSAAERAALIRKIAEPKKDIRRLKPLLFASV